MSAVVRYTAMSSRPLSTAQRRAVAELLRVSPVADELGRRFAAAGHELHLVGGSVRDALLGRLGDDLDFTTDAHPEQTLELVTGWAEAIWATGAEFGTIGACRAAACGWRSPPSARRRTTGSAAIRSCEYGTSLADDLRRRDFTVNAMAVSLPGPRVHRSVRRRWPTWPPGCCAPRARRGSPSPTIRCGCCGPPGSPPSCGSRVVREVVDADAGDGRRPAPDHRGADPGRVHQADGGADPIAGLRLLVDTGLAEIFLPELTGLRLEIDEHAQHKDVYEHTLTVVAQRDRPRGPAARLHAADGRADARHRQAGDQGGRPGRAGQLPPPRGGRRPADPAADEGDAVPEGQSSPTSSSWSRCTCASTGTAGASGPTRRCAATSPTLVPLLARLHKLTRSDCTTRNRRKAARLAADYDALEDADRRDRGGGGSGPGPSGPRRQRDHGAARRAAGAARRAGLAAPQGDAAGARAAEQTGRGGGTAAMGRRRGDASKPDRRPPEPHRGRCRCVRPWLPLRSVLSAVSLDYGRTRRRWEGMPAATRRQACSHVPCAGATASTRMDTASTVGPIAVYHIGHSPRPVRSGCCPRPVRSGQCRRSGRQPCPRPGPGRLCRRRYRCLRPRLYPRPGPGRPTATPETWSGCRPGHRQDRHRDSRRQRTKRADPGRVSRCCSPWAWCSWPASRPCCSW